MFGVSILRYWSAADAEVMVLRRFLGVVASKELDDPVPLDPNLAVMRGIISYILAGIFTLLPLLSYPHTLAP